MKNNAALWRQAPEVLMERLSGGAAISVILLGLISLLAVWPRTGRTHQIRVHLSTLGHPVLGDKVYGLRTKRDLEKSLGVSRQMLHAERLGFDHPRTRQYLEFSVPPPPDMEMFLVQLKNSKGTPPHASYPFRS